MMKSKRDRGAFVACEENLPAKSDKTVLAGRIGSVRRDSPRLIAEGPHVIAVIAIGPRALGVSGFLALECIGVWISTCSTFGYPSLRAMSSLCFWMQLEYFRPGGADIPT